MQYTDYIAAYNARREREQQLANTYNQKPASQRVQNLWMLDVQKKSACKEIQLKELWGIVASLVIAAAIIILAVR